MDRVISKITDALEEIEVVSDYLYQQKINKAYSRLNNTLGKIMELTELLYMQANEGRLIFDRQRLISSLTAAMNAMENKDNTLLADILVFEIGGQLQETMQ